MSKLKPAVSSTDHIQGNENAPIELVEYGDYECSYCGQAYPIIKLIQKKMGDQLKFVFRNFPLEDAHPHAMHAALAAEAAALQNKFWEMHDAIYEHQKQLADGDLVNYAKNAGLDIKIFETDFAQPDIQKRIEEDFENGVRSGVNGTPSFFINGDKYNGSWEPEELLQYLQRLV